MDNSILVWLGICRAKRKGYDHCYQTICHQNEPLWTVLAAYSSSSQTRTGFFLYFFFSIWSNEHDACLIIRGMNGCMYLAREKSYLCFFSRRIRFLLVCPSGHRNWASVTDRLSDDHYKGMFTNYVHKILDFFDHLLPCVDSFYGMNIDKKWTF